MQSAERDRINNLVCQNALIHHDELYFNGEDIKPLSQWNVWCPSECKKKLVRKRNIDGITYDCNCNHCTESLKNEFNVFRCPNADQCNSYLCETCFAEYVRIDGIVNDQVIDGAILYSDPGQAPQLVLTQEVSKLQNYLGDIYQNKSFKLFVGVLTKTSLIRCMQRGAKFLHILGHGPPKDELLVEDKCGGYQYVAKESIKNAIDAARIKTLKMVFTSMCYSSRIASAFAEANVDHVIGIDGQVQIHDLITTTFASTFYESLIKSRKTIQQAFDNARGAVTLENLHGIDCCCRHTGHVDECKCNSCSLYKCCTKHPRRNCGDCKANESDSSQCCNPQAPHENRNKFKLLGNGNHDVSARFLDHKMKQRNNVYSNRQFKVISNECPTNIHDFLSNGTKIEGRNKDVFEMIKFLHPDPFNVHYKLQCDVAILYGAPKIGTTSTALLVGKFFSRPWYEPLFRGGVWYVDMENNTNLTTTNFWETIGSSRNLKEARTQFFYRKFDNDSKDQEQKQEKIAYDEKINEKLVKFHKKIQKNIFDNSYYHSDEKNCKYHFFFFKKAKCLREKEKLEQFICTHYDDAESDEIEEIYEIITNKKNKRANVDISISAEDGTIEAHTFFKFGDKNGNVKKALLKGKFDNTLLIIDHVKFNQSEDVRQFIENLDELVNDKKYKILLVSNEKNHSQLKDKDIVKYWNFHEYRQDKLNWKIIQSILSTRYVSSNMNVVAKT